jgi:multimeric flavodoxin WrbA
VNIVVLNGSPKGELSVTLQYVNYVAKKFPEHTYRVHNVSQQAGKIARSEAAFASIMDDVGNADAVIWSFPVYAFLVPSQYKRFIELIFTGHQETSFRGKYAASLSTSLHFYDHTAHNYLHGICDDLEMRFWGSYSAGMQDLLDEAERQKLLAFAEDFFRAVQERLPTARTHPPVVSSAFTYEPRHATRRVDSRGKKILVLTDLENEQTNLGRMIARFRDSFTGGVDIVNIREIDIKGGCLGCVQCGFDNTCIYEGKDDFISFYEERYKTADMVAFAPVLKDRAYSWQWKLLYDRGFYRGHTPALKGKQVMYIFSGPLSQLPNLRELFTASAEMGYTNLVTIVTDESENSAAIDALLQSGAERMMRLDEQGYVAPPSFLSVGGHKIFRDLVWGSRFFFQADFKYYRKNKMFDFPQRDRKAIAFNRKMLDMMEDPVVKEEIRKSLKEQMVRPHQKVVATK